LFSAPQVQSVRLALRASRLLFGMTPGILPFAAPRPASLFAPLLRRSAQKVTKKARHRTRCFDSHPANQNPLCFSGTAGSSESTSMCLQPTRARRARAPSGNFRRTLRCSAPRTAPVCARTRASLHCVVAIVCPDKNLPQEQQARTVAVASAAGCRPNGAPCGAANAWRESPKGRAQDAREFAARTWMCAQRTPERVRALGGQDARRARYRGCVSLVTFFSQAKKVTRSAAGRVEALHSRGATKARNGRQEEQGAGFRLDQLRC